MADNTGNPMNTSVANTQRWREWRAKNPKNKDKYPNVASFLKDFPTKAANYQKAANASAAAPKKRSFKNRVKGFFSKVGSRFSKKKNAKQANKNFVQAAEVEELNAQTKNLKNLLQHQVENAGDLNMNNATKKIVQDNIETTRKLIEARQQELTSREAKDKLEELKKNVVSVGKVVEAAPTSANASKLGNVSELKAAAVNALKRMGGMDGVAEQIAALKKMIEDCCEEGGMGRGRSGSVVSVGTNKRVGENGEEAEATNSGSGAPSGRPNFLERMPAGLPRRRPNLFEPAPGGLPKRRNNTNMPSPAGLFGSNNFENEPAPEAEAPNPRGLFGSNNFEEEAPRANATGYNVSPAGLFGSNNFENEPPRANRVNANENKPFGNNVGSLFSNAPNAPKNYRVARGNNKAATRINEYGNVGNLFSGAPPAPKNYKVAQGTNQPEPTPAGLFGSNNFENEPAPAAEAPNPRGLFGSNNFENEPVPAAPAAANRNEPAPAVPPAANGNGNAAARAAAEANRNARAAAEGERKAREAREKAKRNAELARKTAKRNAARGVASRRGSDEEYFGLRPGYTERDLDVAYRNLSMMHPNQGGTAAEFKNLGQRYDRLKARFAAAENPFDRYDDLQDLYDLRNAGEEAYGGIGSRAQLQAAIRAKGGVAGGRRRTQRKKRTVSRKSRKVRK